MKVYRDYTYNMLKQKIKYKEKQKKRRSKFYFKKGKNTNRVI